MIKVVIADDSALLRQILKETLDDSGKIRVIGAAKNGKEAIEFVKIMKPDLLILDCEMPVMNGLEALKKIMDECPLPVFIFSSLAYEGSQVTVKALELGAVDFFLKPTKGAPALHEVSEEIIRKIEFIVLKSKFAYLHKKKEFSFRKPVSKQDLDKELTTKKKIDIIAVGSSTGGVQAATNFLPGLPNNLKPIVWVQHMPPNFTKSFAARLDTLSQVTVKEAENNDILLPGHCYIAPGGYQMRVIKRYGSNEYRIALGETDKVSGHCPSCDVLFKSVAENCENILSVILTGMGEDGTKGLIDIHNKGGYVIGQNEESCVVYGMPKAAFEAGAVDIELDIHSMPNFIINKVR